MDQSFRQPGRLNDINVLDSSIIVTGILKKRFLLQFDYSVNKHTQSALYFLADVIYPPSSKFVNTIQKSGTRKTCTYLMAQKALLKEFELDFWVLVSCQAHLGRPCMKWDRSLTGKFMKVKIIVHNMIVKAMPGGYKSELRKI